MESCKFNSIDKTIKLPLQSNIAIDTFTIKFKFDNDGFVKTVNSNNDAYSYKSNTESEIITAKLFNSRYPSGVGHIFHSYWHRNYFNTLKDNLNQWASISNGNFIIGEYYLSPYDDLKTFYGHVFKFIDENQHELCLFLTKGYINSNYPENLISQYLSLLKSFYYKRGYKEHWLNLKDIYQYQLNILEI